MLQKQHGAFRNLWKHAVSRYKAAISSFTVKNVCSAELPLLKSLQYCTEIEQCHCVCTDVPWCAWWCHTNSLSLGRVQRRLGWDYLFRIPSQHIYMPRRDTTDIRPLEELCEVQKCTNWSSLLFHIPFVTSCCMDLFLCLGVQGYNHRWYLLRFLQQNRKELKQALGSVWEILSILILQAEVSERSWSFISLVCIMNFIKSKSWKCSSKKKKKKDGKAGRQEVCKADKSMSREFCISVPCIFLDLVCWMCSACLITSINKFMG